MCDNENYSCFVTFLLAILLGFLVGLLIFLGLISDVTIGLIIAIVSAFIISIAFFVVIILPRYNKCIRKHSCGILIGIIGTIFFATIALSIDLDENIISAILVGLVVFFLAYLIIKFLKLLNCVIRRNREDEDSNDTATILNTPINLDATLNTIDINNNLNSESNAVSNSTSNASNSNSESYKQPRYCNNYNRNFL